MPAEIVVLGGGVGGTLLANLIDKRLKRDAHVTVVDPAGMHFYQPGYLYVALGQANGRWLARDERTLLRRHVDLIVDGASAVDADAHLVELARGARLHYDHLVVATGARLLSEQVPGMDQGAHTFYSLEGALRLREALRSFRGGVLAVGIAGMPYKCPPAPVEFTLMLEQYLRAHGVRDKTRLKFLSPINGPLSIESASKLVQPIMESRGIELETFFNVETVDPSAHAVTSLEGDKLEYDMLVLVPPHGGQPFVASSGLGSAGGWLPVDRATLQHPFHDDVYGLGDATDLPISKSGSTAHFEAPVIASRIASKVDGSAPDERYGGKVMCFLETGGGKATTLRFDYEHPPAPRAPSRTWHAAKWLFNRLYWSTVPKGRIP